MREYKFRGKRKDNGEWVYGYYADYDGSPIIYSFSDPAFPVEIVPETVGQYTGLKDKKGSGEDLYQKDIVLLKAESDGGYSRAEQMGIIEWIDDGWAIVDKDGEYLCSLWDYIYNYCGGKQSSVAENPELLEK